MARPRRRFEQTDRRGRRSRGSQSQGPLIAKSAPPGERLDVYPAGVSLCIRPAQSLLHPGLHQHRSQPTRRGSRRRGCPSTFRLRPALRARVVALRRGRRGASVRSHLVLRASVSLRGRDRRSVRLPARRLPQRVDTGRGLKLVADLHEELKRLGVALNSFLVAVQIAVNRRCCLAAAPGRRGLRASRTGRVPR
jgi:hypothetical protein